MLRELEVPHETHLIDREKTENKSETFLSLNPLGKIPVLVVNDHPITESAAIVKLLADMFPERQMIPSVGTVERGKHDQWLFFVLTEIESAVWSFHRYERLGKKRSNDLAETDWSLGAAFLEEQLANQTYLTGENFQAVDIVLSHLLTWKVMKERLSKFPKLEEYMERTTSRPAFPKEFYR